MSRSLNLFSKDEDNVCFLSIQKKFCRVFIGLSLFILVSVSTIAQEVDNFNDAGDDSFNLDTITVTADKRELDSQKVPTSISVKTEMDLSDSEVFTSEKLFNILPNIHLANSGPWAKNLPNEKYATTCADMRNYGYDVVAQSGDPQHLV